MEDYKTERTAMRLVQKYGMKALPKAVEVAKYYVTEGDNDNAKRWVRIGYAVRRALKIEDIKEAIKAAAEAEKV